MTLSTQTSPIIDAIRQARVVLSSLPESVEARELSDQCLAYERIAERWEQVPPSPEEREALMKKVVSLHIVVIRVRRSSFPPPPRSG